MFRIRLGIKRPSSMLLTDTCSDVAHFCISAGFGRQLRLRNKLCQALAVFVSSVNLCCQLLVRKNRYITRLFYYFIFIRTEAFITKITFPVSGFLQQHVFQLPCKSHLLLSVCFYYPCNERVPFVPFVSCPPKSPVMHLVQFHISSVAFHYHVSALFPIGLG